MKEVQEDKTQDMKGGKTIARTCERLDELKEM